MAGRVRVGVRIRVSNMATAAVKVRASLEVGLGSGFEIRLCLGLRRR